MTRDIRLTPLDELQPDPRNPKGHDVATMEASIARFGFVEPVVVDGRTGRIVSGHGRTKTLKALHQRGAEPPAGVTVDDTGRWLVPVTEGWESKDDLEAAGTLIALNRINELGGWVDDSLLALLDDLAGYDALTAVGYGQDDIDEIRARLADIENEPDESDPGDGWSTGVGTDLQKINTDALWGEPVHQPHHGQTWKVGRHLLVVARVHSEHHLWAPHLEGRLFCPYPDPYLTRGTTAAENDLLMVTPHTYIAGHLLDRHAETEGPDSVTLSRGQS